MCLPATTFWTRPKGPTVWPGGAAFAALARCRKPMQDLPNSRPITWADSTGRGNRPYSGGVGMKRLILTRHAKSSWEDPLTPDHDRPLNERGRAAAADLGQWLASRGYVPGQVLCSDALRTRKTWAGIAPAIPPGRRWCWISRSRLGLTLGLGRGLSMTSSCHGKSWPERPLCYTGALQAISRA